MYRLARGHALKHGLLLRSCVNAECTEAVILPPFSGAKINSQKRRRVREVRIMNSTTRHQFKGLSSQVASLVLAMFSL